KLHNCIGLQPKFADVYYSKRNDQTRARIHAQPSSSSVSFEQASTSAQTSAHKGTRINRVGVANIWDTALQENYLTVPGPPLPLAGGTLTPTEQRDLYDSAPSYSRSAGDLARTV